VNLVFAAPQTQAVALKAKLFRGFADPSRLAIVEALRGGPMTVTELVEATGLTQSNASNHLGCLRDCGLVSREQEGRYVRYRLSDRRVATLLAEADALLAEFARGVYECTRYGAGPPRRS
jgi:DNA-binding transcriptional ArsR family regulator